MSETRVVHVDDNIEGAVYIGRANGRKGLKASPFANGFLIGPDGDRAEVIRLYRETLELFLTGFNDPTKRALCLGLMTLRGKPMACWCRHDGQARTPETACHGDILVSLLDRYSDDELRAMGGQG